MPACRRRQSTYVRTLMESDRNPVHVQREACRSRSPARLHSVGIPRVLKETSEIFRRSD